MGKEVLVFLNNKIASSLTKTLLDNKSRYKIALTVALVFVSVMATTASSATSITAQNSQYKNLPPLGQSQQGPPSWWSDYKLLPHIPKLPEANLGYAIFDAKIKLEASVISAEALFEASADKAEVETRRKLLAARNTATSTMVVSDDIKDYYHAQEKLDNMEVAVNEEVTAWEVAEAARKAAEEAARKAAEEAARKAQEAKQRSTATAPRSSSGSSSSSSSGDGKAYLNGVAGQYGVTINWASSACGRSGSWVVGCSTGRSVTVTTNAYSSWDRAHGEGRNVVLHEVGHMLTYAQCGTMYIGGDRFENVNDAVGVLLGGGATGYGYNSADMALARSIRAGNCS